ncbi:MAG: pyridoxal-phosphate dependent enzyme [Chlorobium sp.]|uniref:pyridoxal-phosphate dependent enzyme n=1 Tax=Chlorobium sp. TaxID=1095 RepID=UPI001DE9C062|nr:pyridoxal-phosphate dependent enzyme [Chlorobium sp.]MBN1279357.1 pyridoxal-phosphate dependent enzyme [Chlorobiaceae bacterium]MCF8215384.1 pyridoxal-phosphate dependent enzyme [Chlorobium sp.]MCF8270222.1 pyridoxal-phosphate dependent enzyme [Chlorobium sp.]MCF8286591.1 pyridoxal-phosphate dependent enzyme [Chlorobium sp.]MCF8290190.1 pyridoxal-phosphate dependent enzyme [Chlorobium sp.]
MSNHDIFEITTETPLVLIGSMARNLKPVVMAKLEYMNPACSHYYRAASALIRDAEDRRLIHPGMTLVDWTYGNSGIALAMAGVSRGYKLLLVAPDKISREKQDVLRALGAEMVITPSDALPGEPRSCVKVAQSLVRNISNAFFANMYENPLSRDVHASSTGGEILRQTDGRVSHVFVPMISGAMISGIGRFLKAEKPSVKIIGVEPEGSVYRSLFTNDAAFSPSVYELEEIGAPEPSRFWEPSVIDDIVQVSDEDAFNCGRELLKAEAVFAGGASGAVMAAALRSASACGAEDCVVAVLNDFGGYYLSKMFLDSWMKQKGFYRKAKTAIEQITAEDILQLKARKDLIFASPESTLAEVFEMMKQNDVSQLPIVSYGTPIGSISENRILSILIENDDAMNSKVVGFMEQPFPVCRPDATISELSGKLQQSASGLLISLSDGRLQLLTKSDLIDALTHK